MDKLCADVRGAVRQQGLLVPAWTKRASWSAASPSSSADLRTQLIRCRRLGLKPNTLGGAGRRQAARPPRRPPACCVKTCGAACAGHMDQERYEFCWIVDFPMYEIGEESGELEFCHNPFSMPNGGLEVLLKAERGRDRSPDHHRRPVRPGVQRRGALLRRGAEPRPGDHDEGLRAGAAWARRT